MLTSLANGLHARRRLEHLASNPLRFIKGDPPPFDELFQTMTKRARGMKTDNIKTEDLARSGGAPDEE